jgi:5-methylcytosine-specific restriction endonuclease McrA
MVKKIQHKKAVIPQKVRQEVWIKHFGEQFGGKCPVVWCTKRITVFCFEAGHNIPESKGGRTTIDNLIPICGECNRSMGDRYTIEEFSRLHASLASSGSSAEKKPESFWQRLCSCFARKAPPKPPSLVTKRSLNNSRFSVRTIYR